MPTSSFYFVFWLKLRLDALKATIFSRLIRFVSHHMLALFTMLNAAGLVGVAPLTACAARSRSARPTPTTFTNSTWTPQPSRRDRASVRLSACFLVYTTYSIGTVRTLSIFQSYIESRRFRRPRFFRWSPVAVRRVGHSPRAYSRLLLTYTNIYTLICLFFNILWCSMIAVDNSIF